jgi:dihydropteroate synthase
MAEVTGFLAAALERGEAAGIERTQMLIDPGIGFGKTVAHNLEILRRLAELESLGVPIVVGPSRKRFIGAVSDSPPGERVEGTIAACVLAARNGANVLRVHDVKPVVRALKLADAVELRN